MSMNVELTPVEVEMLIGIIEDWLEDGFDGFTSYPHEIARAEGISTKLSTARTLHALVVGE